MDHISAEQLDQQTLLALLRWYADMGVDVAVSENAHDRFTEMQATLAAQSARSPQQSSPLDRQVERQPAARPAPVADNPRAATARPAPVAPDVAARSASEAAKAAGNLDALRQAMEDFDGCALKRTASRLVFCDGNPSASIMLVGEAPGADEDRQGKPFVGRAGQLLDLMLASVGLDRTSVYIANVIPWRPPGNRTPTPQETAICLPFIRRQIELAGPQVLVCLGGSAVQTLLGEKQGITRTRGRWYSYPLSADAAIPSLAMLHPAYLLRAPIQKKLAWKDLRTLQKHLLEKNLQ